ncbi:FtsB family cell division protein [Mycolicibacterium frederiksbergense]|uniref:FtsB family cell division protein n=1 Tax=Mycolicibacterium frederiksbergense TaxID=117567 RepID=UPI00265C0716|nr:septum formation initiator family protein [Mycolicibacterium frederiksbergense]MDO0975133.1 septum formation initiator family protein [Mycolicibacterium frederiksbergense]
MPDAKRPDPRRRGPAPRPGKAGGAGRPRAASRREPRAIESREGREVREAAAEPLETGAGSPDAGPDTVAEAIRKSVAESAEQQSDQRFGSAARRAAILAAVVCVLTLTIAGPVRTYFAQRTEMNQLKTVEAQLRSQIADLEQQKIKLEDPVFIAAQARERLGFVMPGDIPYQVQLPPGATAAPVTGPDAPEVASGDPWYTSLWHTIADAPHGVSPMITPAPVPAEPTDVPADPPPAGG